MVTHIISYSGVVKTVLGVLQLEYGSEFLPWPNKLIGIEGTLQRPPYTWGMWREFVEGLDKSKGKNEVFAVLALEAKGEERSYRYIGHTGLHGIDHQHKFATTGSILGPLGQNKGHGTEAKLLTQEHGYCTLGLRKLTSTVKAWNARSLAHLLKTGYRIVGRYKQHHFHDGAYVDEILLECFREDWEPIWERYKKTKELPTLTQKQRALVEKETKK